MKNKNSVSKEDRNFPKKKGNIPNDSLSAQIQSIRTKKCPSSYNLSQISAWTKRDFVHLCY